MRASFVTCHLTHWRSPLLLQPPTFSSLTPYQSAYDLLPILINSLTRSAWCVSKPQWRPCHVTCLNDPYFRSRSRIPLKPWSLISNPSRFLAFRLTHLNYWWLRVRAMRNLRMETNQSSGSLLLNQLLDGQVVVWSDLSLSHLKRLNVGQHAPRLADSRVFELSVSFPFYDYHMEPMGILTRRCPPSSSVNQTMAVPTYFTIVLIRFGYTLTYNVHKPTWIYIFFPESLLLCSLLQSHIDICQPNPSKLSPLTSRDPLPWRPGLYLMGAKIFNTSFFQRKLSITSLSSLFIPIQPVHNLSPSSPSFFFILAFISRQGAF